MTARVEVSGWIRLRPWVAHRSGGGYDGPALIGPLGTQSDPHSLDLTTGRPSITLYQTRLSDMLTSGRSNTKPTTLADRFRQWAEQAGATVEIVPDEAAATAAVQNLAQTIGASRLAATAEAARFAPSKAMVGGSASQIADADLGVSLGRLAVAETGSVLLGSNVLEDRLVAMLTRTHAVVVPAQTLVASLDDAAPVLRRLTAPGADQLRYVGFITGPSRTADIERVLTIGVQGPRALHLIVVGSG